MTRTLIVWGGETLNEEIPKEISDPTQKHNGQPATENAQPAISATHKTTQQTAGCRGARTVSRAGSVQSETLEDISKEVAGIAEEMKARRRRRRTSRRTRTK